jgi:3-oxoacyl-[acyl-carrier protein] reductase
MRHTPERIVLVTGGSAGIGAAVARQLASADTHVIVNYRRNAERAEAVAQTIRDAGGHASTTGADIADEADAFAMIGSIAARFGRIDAVILNASGGSALAVDTGDAMRRNREAQRRLARLAVPLMPSGGRVVFVTSHQAHFFPHKAVPKGYAMIAASKRAGETALYTMRSEFAHAGIHFTVVSGNMADDTISLEPITQLNPARPTVGEFATAIVNAANTTHPTNVVFVGGSDYPMSA